MIRRSSADPATHYAPKPAQTTTNSRIAGVVKKNTTPPTAAGPIPKKAPVKKAPPKKKKPPLLSIARIKSLHLTWPHFFYATIIIVSVVLFAAINTLVYPRIITLAHRAKASHFHTPTDPELDPKHQEFQQSSIEKNIALRTFNPCKNYHKQFAQAGYPIHLIRKSLDPEEIHVSRNPGKPIYHGAKTRYYGNHTCFWGFDWQGKSYITIQNSHYNKTPEVSEIEYSIKNSYDDARPPNKFSTVPYLSIRYDIKGYLAHIATAYDPSIKKRVCYVVIAPYLTIGATGNDCPRVLELTKILLPS